MENVSPRSISGLYSWTTHNISTSVWSVPDLLDLKRCPSLGRGRHLVGVKRLKMRWDVTAGLDGSSGLDVYQTWSWSRVDALHHRHLHDGVVHHEVDDLHHRQNASAEQQSHHAAQITCQSQHGGRVLRAATACINRCLCLLSGNCWRHERAL